MAWLLNGSIKLTPLLLFLDRICYSFLTGFQVIFHVVACSFISNALCMHQMQAVKALCLLNCKRSLR